MLKFILKNLHILGGMFIGLGIPTQKAILLKDNPMYDLIFIPIGILCLLISYYYTFKVKS